MQLHLGARRNNNTRLFHSCGPDTGFDPIGDCQQVDALAKFLDRLDQENALPRTILYNLNPADNYAFAAMLGNFQDGRVPEKIQLASGWWSLDQKEAMEWQLNALSNLGLLSRFVGMVTDSRSLMSYPRHEYFRRVPCNLIGRDIEEGCSSRQRRACGHNDPQHLLPQRPHLFRLLSIRCGQSPILLACKLTCRPAHDNSRKRGCCRDQRSVRSAHKLQL